MPTQFHRQETYSFALKLPVVFAMDLAAHMEMDLLKPVQTSPACMSALSRLPLRGLILV